MKNKLAYICHPYRGKTKKETERNIQMAIKYGKYAVSIGYTPVIPHLLTKALYGWDTHDKSLDLEIVEMDMQLLQSCKELLVCGSKISKGMKAEIDQWHKWGGRIIKIKVY